ncbi:MAG: hypothetical protein AAF493_27225 [Pseudomonadota bacterium]
MAVCVEDVGTSAGVALRGALLIARDGACVSIEARSATDVALCVPAALALAPDGSLPLAATLGVDTPDVALEAVGD